MSSSIKTRRIALIYAEIKKLIDSASYSKIIKATNKIFNEDHNQPEAWQCKVVACIQLDQFRDAALTIAKAPNAKQMQFELAYCQYRMNDAQKALATLDMAADKGSLRGQELRAQILYRLEQHSQCYAVYRDLLRSTVDDLDMERSTNMAAVQVHRAMHGQVDVPPAPGSAASYEQWYNSGCAAVAAGDTQQALVRLQEAMKQCRILLQGEGAGEEELQQEQAIIRVQQGYVLQRDGRDKEAAAEYTEVLQHRVADAALLAILHNNLAVSNRDANVMDTRKKMKATQVAELEHKLTSSQRDQLALNNCILAYHTQQPQQEDASTVDECTKLLSSPSTTHPVRVRAVLVLAASLAKSGRVEEAVQRLHQWEAQNKDDARIIRLAATQIRLMKSDVMGGVAELSAMPAADKYSPGVVGSVVTLLASRKQKAFIGKLYKEAVLWHRQNKGAAPPPSVQRLLRRAADHHLKEGDPQSAAAALEQYRGMGTEGSDDCLASLIHAYSQFDSAKAGQLTRDLPPSTLATSSLDAEALEASLGPKYFQKAAHKLEDEAAAAKTGSPADKIKAAAPGARVKPRKKKQRKTVLPKSYVKGDMPDPERWLPRWQRKTGGAKRRQDRRRERDVGRGTQGGVGDATDKYDISKNPGQHKGSSVQQQQQPESSAPRRNMPKKKTTRKK